MKNIKNIILLLSISVFVIACDTDLKINDDWECIPVVYYIFDQTDDVHYVKVNKAFLGDASAAEMAIISDSLFFDNADVKLYVINQNGNKQLLTTFVETNEVPKDSGYFANDRNTLYKSDYDFSSINDIEDKSFELEVQVDLNNQSYDIKGESQPLYGSYISKPNSFNAPIEIKNYSSDFEYEYVPGYNAKVSQMIIDFHYLEIENGDTTYHTISWPQSTKVVSYPNVDVVGQFKHEALYNLIKANIAVKPNVKRLVAQPNSITFNLATADDDYYRYMQISAPSTGIAQSKPVYTNLQGGVGLFASKTNVQQSKKLGFKTVDSISYGIYTYDLGFANKDDPYYSF